MNTKKKERNFYEVRPLDTSPVALAEVRELFIRGGSAMSGDWSFLDWQYTKNPAGMAVGYNAYYQGLLVAHYVTIPMRAMVFGREASGVLSINTRTDAAHQGQGLFTRLAELTYTRAKELGHEFVVGVANENSVYGFTKKLGFQHVGLLETRLTLSQPDLSDVNLDFSPIWDAPSVAWRLMNPSKSYKYREKGSRAFIYGNSQKFSALIGEVDSNAVPEGLDTYGARMNPINLWIGMSGGTNWQSTLNIKVPQKLKKVPLNFIYRDLVGSRKLTPDLVRFWAMDFDSY